jgi:hypothetical protein
MGDLPSDNERVHGKRHAEPASSVWLGTMLLALKENDRPVARRDHAGVPIKLTKREDVQMAPMNLKWTMRLEGA